VDRRGEEEMAERGKAFEAYSYRTSSRFGSRVRVSIDGPTVTVVGPRIGVSVYRAWIVVQLIIFWLIVPVLLAAVVLWDWRYLVLALALGVIHWAVGTFGAVSFWELANLSAFMEGSMGATVTFPVSEAKRVKIGRGWARNGLWLVIPLYMPGLNKAAEGVCVSFEAPDGDTGGDAVYALHTQTKECAQSLADALGETGQP
jgi:hypothetical protein